MLSQVLYVLTSTNYSPNDQAIIKNNVSTYINNMTSQSLVPFKLIKDSGLSLEIHAFVKSSNKLFVGTYKGIYTSFDDGVNWNESNMGIDFLEIRSLALNKTSVFAGTNGGGIFRSTDNGDSWMNISGDMLKFYTINSIVSTDRVTIIGTNMGLFRSIDNGDTWVENNFGTPYYEIVVPTTTTTEMPTTTTSTTAGP